ncbi:MAG TPA: LPS export ABC transporter periplasmic protein LptC [Gammaproteobacteria bacterium]|nr:LPS export ABC transporter periplasmic protein LptC [Gammaproteobacteria bacterium]
MNLRFWPLILVLALAAAGTWWLLRHVTPPVIQKPAPATHEPDYYFTDATVTTLDDQGKPEAVMTAPRILHHPDDDSVEVFAPRVEYFIAGGQPWQLQADHALLPSGGKLVELDGHVEMQRAGNNGGPPLVIHTDKMNVDLDTNIATTADPVEIVQGNSRMTGVGMQAYLKDNRLQLEANIRGYYVRKQ